MRERKMLLRLVLAAAGVWSMCGIASAADVTLKARDGEFTIAGELRAFENGKYTIMTKSFGVMSLDASRFDCVGGECPKAPVPAARPATGAAPFSVAALQVEGGQLPVLIAGSNTIGNQLMPALIQAFATTGNLTTKKVVSADPLDVLFKLETGGREIGVIDLRRHGSTTAFKELEAKKALIGMSSRPIKAEEAQRLATAGLGDLKAPDSEHVLGLDGLQVLVSPDSKLVSISLDNLAQVFAGQITDWSELGLPPGKINVYAPTPDSGTYETFEHLVLKPRNVELTKSAKRTENHAEQSDLVARDPFGIGFAGVAYQRNAKPVNIELSCGLIAVPSVFTMKTEEYPLSRRLYLYTAGEPRHPVARSLLAFALSPAAQPIVKANDFIDQAPEFIGYEALAGRIAHAYNALPEDFDAGLMRTLVSDIKSAQRLSLTFRFQSNSFTLENKALADVARLQAALESPELKGKSVMLLGFADTRGDFPANLRLSERRARAVLQALAAAGAKTANIKVKAFSELAPVACNDTDDGRQFNRRVEVWVK